MKQYDVHQYLAQEMDNRLLLLRREPKHIIVHGADGDVSRALLAKRYPKSQISEFDHRQNVLAEAAAIRKNGFWAKLTGQNVPQKCTTTLPEKQGDMLWANLMLPFSGSLNEQLANWAHVLQDEGMLFFTCFGAESLLQVREILQQNNVSLSEAMLPEMHDLGDMLLEHHFYDPIVDTAKLVLSYQDWVVLQQDWDNLGIWQILQPENLGLAQTVLQTAWQNGHLRQITLETLFGHALKKTILPNNEQPIVFYPQNKMGA